MLKAVKEPSMSATSKSKPRAPISAPPRRARALSVAERRELADLNERFDREIVRLHAEADELLRQIKARNGA